jgi:hypothetical protein
MRVTSDHTDNDDTAPPSIAFHTDLGQLRRQVSVQRGVIVSLEQDIQKISRVKTGVG